MIAKNKNQGERGFLLYLSVLLSGLAVSIGLFMLNTARREILFSGYAREADYAFYAAEAGAECALYWDLIGINKRTAFPQLGGEGNAYMSNIICASDWTEANAGPGASAPHVVLSGDEWAVSVFSFNVPVGGKNYCASVSVNKISHGGVFTSIEAYGYNVDCASHDTSSSADAERFKRAIRLSY